MGLLTPGYWPSTYWPENYWPDDYWADAEFHSIRRINIENKKPTYRLVQEMQ